MDHWIRSLLLPASGAVTVLAAVSVLFPPLLLLFLLFPLALLPPRDQPSVIPLPRRCGLRLLRLALDQLPTPALQKALHLLVSSQTRHLSLTWEPRPSQLSSKSSSSIPLPPSLSSDHPHPSDGLGWWIQGASTPPSPLTTTTTTSPSPSTSSLLAAAQKDSLPFSTSSSSSSSSSKPALSPTSFSPLPTPPSSLDSPNLSSFPLSSSPTTTTTTTASLLLVLWIPVIGWGWGHSLLAAPALTQWIKAWRMDQEEELEKTPPYLSSSPPSDLRILALDMDVSSSLENQVLYISNIVQNLKSRYQASSRKVQVILAGAGAGATVALHVPGVDGVVGMSPWVKSPSSLPPSSSSSSSSSSKEKPSNHDSLSTPSHSLHDDSSPCSASPSPSLSSSSSPSSPCNHPRSHPGQTRDFLPPRMVLAPWPSSTPLHHDTFPPSSLPRPGSDPNPIYDRIPVLLVCGSRELSVEDTVGWACQEEEEGRGIRVCVEQGGMFGCGVGWAGVDESVMARGTQRVLSYLHGIDRGSSSWKCTVR
ncbi:MAG: hypothetical protein DHS80DRAFT_22634 [Piptocephalis tieghemiana]|nr:MAG: hypothetical protein DHS80DRAFT_22634 [Piptocephalis tieghemiana]